MPWPWYHCLKWPGHLKTTVHIGVDRAKAHQRANAKSLHCIMFDQRSTLSYCFRPVYKILRVQNGSKENLRRHCLEWMQNAVMCNCASRLNELGLQTMQSPESLELRRLHTYLIMCYKILFIGLVDASFNDFFQYPTVANTRGNAVYTVQRVQYKES